jgi:hypothetical protein
MSADFASELIVRKDDNILVQWGKMVTSNVCSKWWVAPLLIIALIYCYWKLDECQRKLKEYEGLESEYVRNMDYVGGDVNGHIRRKAGTLDHRHQNFSEAPSFWNSDAQQGAAKNWKVTEVARAAKNLGVPTSSGIGKSVAALEADNVGTSEAFVAEAFMEHNSDPSKGEQEMTYAAALAGH